MFQDGTAFLVWMLFLLGVVSYGLLREHYTQAKFERLGPVGYHQQSVRWADKWFGVDSAAATHMQLMLARTHQVLGQTEQALIVLEGMPVKNPRIKTQVGGSFYYFHTGLLQYSAGRYQDALHSFGATARLRRHEYPDDDNPTQPLPHVSNRCSICNRRRKPPVIHWHKVASALQWVGKCHEKLGNYDEAMATHQQVIDELQAHGFGDRIELAKAFLRLANVYHCCCVMGDNDAQQQQQQALDEALRIYLLNEGDYPRSEDVAKIYVQLATLYRGRLEMTKALEYYHEAILVYRRSGRSDEDSVVANLLQAVSDLEQSEKV